MACSGTPDPTDVKAMNTYLTLAEEVTERPLVDKAVLEIEEWLEVIVGYLCFIQRWGQTV